MPTYTFYCAGCDEKTEKLVKADDRDLQVCEKCNESLKRLIDRPGLVWAPTAGGYR